MNVTELSVPERVAAKFEGRNIFWERTLQCDECKRIEGDVSHNLLVVRYCSRCTIIRRRVPMTTVSATEIAR